MTAADIAAYIGAAAWLPQLGTWVYDAYSKPKLKIVSAGKIEIGFSMFGPIANPTLAISAERRDALIEKMSLRVTHEHGEQRFLDWRFLNEVQQQIRDPQGNVSSQYKNTPAVALKVSTLALTERIVGFRDPKFEELDRVTTGPISAQFRHNEAQMGNGAALDWLLNSMEFKHAQRIFEDSMFWRAGKWEFLFSVQLAGVKNPHAQGFSVTFSDDDVTTLRRNFDLLVPYVRAISSDNEEDRKLITWNWVYPSIVPAPESRF
jgi:hypothetical protein